MKPAAFDYLRPESLEEALAALAERAGEAQVLAGGQSLAAMLNTRLARPELLVDIARLAELSEIHCDAGEVEVGASATQAKLERWPELACRLPLLAQAMPHIGHPQTRARGTVCGSIAHADPASELPLCLLTLGGSVTLQSRHGARQVPADEFFTGLLSTACAPDELLAAVRFPSTRPGTGFAFREVAPRRGDFAIVAVAVALTARQIRFGVGGVADRPVCRDWPALEGAALDDALNAFAWELGGHDDLHATARYRRELVRRVGRQAIGEARACLT